MGFLDMFDSPDLMGQLFGIGSASAADSPPPPPPSPPPDVMATAAPSFAAGSPDPGPLSFADRAGPAQDAVTNGTFDPQGNNYTGFDKTTPPAPRATTPGGDVLTQTAGRSIPVPPPAPVQPPVPPQVAATPPPAPPPSNPANGPPAGFTPDGLAQSLGIGPQARPTQAPQVDPRRTMLAGLGRGLSAVGDIKLGGGTSKGSAFAKGAGATIEGGEANQRQQEQDQEKRQNDTFNQKSQAFKDWMGAEKLGNETMITQARSKYYESLNDMRKNGTRNAFAGTPYDKAIKLDAMMDKLRDQARKQHDTAQRSGYTDEQLKALDEKNEKFIQGEQERRAKSYGIDPNEHKRGLSKDLPFDYETLSRDQYLQIQDGAWIRKKDPSNPAADKDGYVYGHRDWLKIPPYEGWQPPSNAQPRGQQQASDPYSVEQQDQSVMAG